MDVCKAFVYGDLDHIINMVQPLGFEGKAHPNYVCKLKKSPYRLKQPPMAWYEKISEFLKHNGFIMMADDASLFVTTTGKRVAIFLCMSMI